MAERLRDERGDKSLGKVETTAVEKTRRGVEAMEVVEEGGSTIKASTERFKGKIAAAAREGWLKIRMRLQGKELKREESELIVGEKVQSGQVGLVDSQEIKGE
jgi:hypothetical protein